MKPLIERYENSIVRDLAWAIASPPLVCLQTHPCDWPSADRFQAMYEETRPFFTALDKCPGELESLLHRQKDRRLGRYFEALWYHWLDNHPDYEILAQNLQVIIDGETLGELDFVVYDRKSGETVHLEVAVKFYLGAGDISSMSSWHGPGRKDRLDRKVEHLRHRQTAITRQAPVRQWLQAQGLVIDRCTVIMKGRLYYPAHEMPATSADLAFKHYSPPEVSPEHLHGWWFRQSEFDRYFTDDEHFAPLINQGWLQKNPTTEKTEIIKKTDFFGTGFHKKYRLPLHVQLQNPRPDWDRAFITEQDWGDKKI